MKDLILVSEGQPWTTSVLVAEKYEKRHDNVVRAIRNLDCSPDFRLLNFEEIEYKDSRGRMMPMYRIRHDGGKTGDHYSAGMVSNLRGV